MNDKRGWGSTVLGWFVVREESEALAPSDLTPGTSATPAEEPSAPTVQAVKELPSSPGGVVDFDKVYEAFGSDAEERDRFAKAADLLRNLPAGTDPVIKKQIVEASLRAFGIPIDKIIEAGVEQIQALDAYQKNGAADTKKVCEEAEKRILEFEEEIRRIRLVMEERVREQTSVIQACNAKKLEVQTVLEFFGQEAVARVVRDSPKLIEPGPAAGQSGA